MSDIYIDIIKIPLNLQEVYSNIYVNISIEASYI